MVIFFILESVNNCAYCVAQDTFDAPKTKNMQIYVVFWPRYHSYCKI